VSSERQAATDRRAQLSEGRVALVTGAGSGIGRATALLFAAEGSRAVVVADVDDAAATETVRLILQTGVEALAVHVDVSNATEVDGLVAIVLETYGRLDSAVNNAGVLGRPALLEDYEQEDWNRVIAVNLNGVFLCMRAEIRAMLANGGGAIVNVASAAHVDPAPTMSAYAASKSGVVALTRAVAGEYAAEHIRINSVLPSRARTEMHVRYFGMEPGLEARAIEAAPMRRFGEPSEVAEAIVWLCSDRASYVHGVAMLVDGGGHAFSHSIRPTPRRGIGGRK